MKIVNRVTEQIIEVEEVHFLHVLSKQGWDELVLPTTVQEYIDAGGFVKPKTQPKPKTTRRRIKK
jgi:hypothetical protein